MTSENNVTWQWTLFC